MNYKKIFLAFIILVAAVGLFFLITIEPEPEESVLTDEEVEMIENTESDYVGLTSVQAVALAQANGVMFRVAEIDGQTMPVTEDYRPGRISAVIENDIVVNYTVEGSESATMDNPYFQENQLDGDMIDTQPPVSETEPTSNDVIIGMTTAEAEAYAKANGVMFRVGAIDGEFLPVTMDYLVGRITASITDGIVTDYSVEGSLE